MRPGQNKRMRGRNNRKGPNPLTRTYESNGPDVKIRGTAHHVAEKYLRRVIQKDTANATAWLLLGIGAYERNELEAAHAHLAQAVLYAPQDARAHQYLGATFGRRGWYSAGEDELRRAVELGGQSLVDAVLMASLNPAKQQIGRAHV